MDIKQAYIYGYPIVGMYEYLYKQVICESRESQMNEFLHSATVATPQTVFVPAPNNDTTYSRAWLDLRKEPVFIDVPDTQDRFYVIQLLNLYSETLANVGRRTTGTKAIRFMIIGPTWKGDIPKDVHVIHSDTTFVLAFLRILIKGQDDLKNVRALQNNIRIRSSSEVNLDNLPVYRNKNAKEFFKTLFQVLRLTPILKGEEDILKEISKIKELPLEVLQKPCDETLKRIDEGGLSFGENVNYWRVARKEIGNYGSNYFQRAVVWYKGALANQPQESLYPTTFQDSEGNALNGNNHYQLVFSKEQIPPVSQFWSLTMYLFKNGFLCDNEINRYSLGDRTKELQYQEDGSLIIYIQHDRPSDKQISNWLPAPKEDFYLTLRLYGPNKQVINGIWQPPAVKKVIKYE